MTPSTVIDTAPGRYQLGGFTISDTHNYGALTVEGVIQKSSNVGALKIAQKMAPQEMWNTYTALGYGQKPQVQFPGAVPGRLRPWKTWRPVEQATMSYGYGLSASLFQMAHSYTAFAHDGEVVPVSLVVLTMLFAGQRFDLKLFARSRLSFRRVDSSKPRHLKRLARFLLPSLFKL